MGRVVIGMDPHKRSATTEAIDERERVLAKGRFGTDTDGYQQMLTAGRKFPDRVWRWKAVRGRSKTSRHRPTPTSTNRSGRFRNSRSLSEHNRSTMDKRQEAVYLRFHSSTAS
jgi:hypothetical protein